MGKFSSRVDLTDLQEVFLPEEKLKEIGHFISDRKPLPIHEIEDQLKAAASENENLLGVISIEEHTSKKGERLFTVTIDEEHFPPNPLLGAGAVYPLRGVAFIKSGFSKPVEEAVRRHEKYHLENGHWAFNSDLHPITGATFRYLHEAETVLVTNILTDPLSTIRTGLELSLRLPKVVLQYISHIRRQVKKLMSST